jgi:hypothetical protein
MIRISYQKNERTPSVYRISVAFFKSGTGGLSKKQGGNAVRKEFCMRCEVVEY